MEKTFDLTARGASVIIQPLDENGDAAGSSIQLTDFADDQDPVTIDELSNAEMIFDINGESLRRAKLEPVSCHIALIPNSKDEKKMNQFALSNLTIFGSYSWVNMTVNYPNDVSVEFYKGFLTGASLGYAATSAGRLRTKNYSFHFTTCGKAKSNS